MRNLVMAIAVMVALAMLAACTDHRSVDQTDTQESSMPLPKQPSSKAGSPPLSKPNLQARLRSGGVIEIRETENEAPRVLAADDPDYDRILAALIDSSVGLGEFLVIPSKLPVSGVRSAPESVGMATMGLDGTLELHLRSDENGSIAEALLVIPRNDPRYPSMLKHLGPLEPGGSCSIRPFPE
jgi:hypothetical protein